MSGYLHGDLLTSRARGWGRGKEEIVPFFSLTLCTHSRTPCSRTVEWLKKKKLKERNKDRKEKNNFC